MSAPRGGQFFFNELMIECVHCKFLHPIEESTCEMCVRESRANDALLLEATRLRTSRAHRKRARKRARDALWTLAQSSGLLFTRTFGW